MNRRQSATGSSRATTATGAQSAFRRKRPLDRRVAQPPCRLRRHADAQAVACRACGTRRHPGTPGHSEWSDLRGSVGASQGVRRMWVRAFALDRKGVGTPTPIRRSTCSSTSTTRSVSNSPEALPNHDRRPHHPRARPRRLACCGPSGRRTHRHPCRPRRRVPSRAREHPVRALRRQHRERGAGTCLDPRAVSRTPTEGPDRPRRPEPNHGKELS